MGIIFSFSKNVPEGEVWLHNKIDGDLVVFINTITSVWARDDDGKLLRDVDPDSAPIIALHDNHIDRLHSLMGPELEQQLIDRHR